MFLIKPDNKRALEQMQDMVRIATEKGMLHNLIYWLSYLNDYGEKYRLTDRRNAEEMKLDTHRVIGYYDFSLPSFSLGLVWQRKDNDGEWKDWMVGGLCLDTSSGEWTVNT